MNGRMGGGLAKGEIAKSHTRQEIMKSHILKDATHRRIDQKQGFKIIKKRSYDSGHQIKIYVKECDKKSKSKDLETEKNVVP